MHNIHLQISALEPIDAESIGITRLGLSSIELNFESGTDWKRARQRVQERLAQAHPLPHARRS